MTNMATHVLLSISHTMVEKVLFLGQIFEMEIFMDLHGMRSPEYKNHSFSDWSVCVFYHHNSKTNGS